MGDAEVYEHNTCRVHGAQEDVVRFEVSMHYVVRSEVLQGGKL